MYNPTAMDRTCCLTPIVTSPVQRLALGGCLQDRQGSFHPEHAMGTGRLDIRVPTSVHKLHHLFQVPPTPSVPVDGSVTQTKLKFGANMGDLCVCTSTSLLTFAGGLPHIRIFAHTRITQSYCLMTQLFFLANVVRSNWPSDIFCLNTSSMGYGL